MEGEGQAEGNGLSRGDVPMRGGADGYPGAARSASAEGGGRTRRDVPAILARIAVAAVFLLNVQCALQFVLWPGAHAGAYELSGVAGEAAVRGLGVAFLMWNATYPAVIASPRRHIALFIVVLVQQAVGLAGETLILAGLPAGHGLLAASILRFIAFDGAGLAVMLAAFVWLAASSKRYHGGCADPRPADGGVNR